MAKAKNYYAVRKGLVPGIYEKWEDCQNNINGFSGAEYHKFSTREEALAFINNKEDDEDNPQIERIYTDSEAVAYVDGSYDSATQMYAYGVVVFYDGGEEHFAEKFNDSEWAIMRNVSGEIKGAMRAMKFCIDMGIKSLDLFYDYEGIEKWCTNAWKANKLMTKEYKTYYNQISKKLKVNFVKVKAHTGNKYNEMADALAKQVLGIGNSLQRISDKNNGIIANGVSYDELGSILELLEEDFKGFKFEQKEIPYGKSIKIEIAEPNRQVLNIDVFNDKLWIHGRKEDLFNRLTLYIVQLLETDEIPEFLNTVHNLDIDTKVVDKEFISFFPNSYDKIPDALNNYLHQAVYNTHITGKMYVCNYLVEPALRPLEGIIKIALQENNIPIRKAGSDYDSFFMFTEKGDKYELKNEFILEEHSQAFLKYLSRCYTYFHKNRNTLFHWDNPKDKVDTTRTLNTVEEAQVIIRDAIALIDDYYKI